MLMLLKNTYLLNNNEVKKSIDRLWGRYQKILDKENASWDDINEARAILYFLGHIFVEIIALESLQKRVKFITPKITLDKFLQIIDSGDIKVQNQYFKNKQFVKLKNFYLLVKAIKNKVNRDNTYLDEDTFNKKYAKLKPNNYF